MNYLSLIKKAPFLLYRKIRTAIKAPIVDIHAYEIFDRLGNPILNHELLNIFNASDSKKAMNCYKKYIDFIIENQEGAWLSEIIGKKKNIKYWVAPWGGFEKKHGNKYLSEEYLARYANKILSVKGQLSRYGYCPKKFGYITGQLLIDESNKKRFIVWNGHKRSLGLINLGYDKFQVEISGGDRWNGKIQNHIIRVADVDDWENVKNGFYTKKEATIFFKSFFK